MDNITIGCGADISNLFTLAQHELSSEFQNIEGITGVFDDMIPDGGEFPLNSGFAARVTTLGQQRLNYARLNLWQPMVGLQENCDISCQPPVETLNLGNEQDTWYRLFWISYNTEPYCLTQLFADKLNVEANIAQVFMDLKKLSIDLNDEFARNNHAALSYNRWMGIAPTTGSPSLQKNTWNFATDSNGFTDTSVIILDAGVNPDEIALLSVNGFLNRIRSRGTRMKTFPVNGEVPIVSDYDTFSDLPLRDTNVRADNRYRAPSVLSPTYADTLSYGGYNLKADELALRYNYSENDPDYPGQTVLRRVNAWEDTPITNGAFSNESEDYENASFQVSFAWGGSTFKRQIGAMPKTAGSGTSFANPTMPWNGMNWRWLNEVNEVTPQNMDRNLGFWRLVAERAARPDRFGFNGHAILHRRFPYTGITGTCAELSVTGAAGYYPASCPPMDFFPPPLVEYTTCGCWNDDGTCPQ